MRMYTYGTIKRLVKPGKGLGSTSTSTIQGDYISLLAIEHRLKFTTLQNHDNILRSRAIPPWGDRTAPSEVTAKEALYPKSVKLTGARS